MATFRSKFYHVWLTSLLSMLFLASVPFIRNEIPTHFECQFTLNSMKSCAHPVCDVARIVEFVDPFFPTVIVAGVPFFRDSQSSDNQCFRINTITVVVVGVSSIQRWTRQRLSLQATPFSPRFSVAFLFAIPPTNSF